MGILSDARKLYEESIKPAVKNIGTNINPMNYGSAGYGAVEKLAQVQDLPRKLLGSVGEGARGAVRTSERLSSAGVSKAKSNLSGWGEVGKNYASSGVKNVSNFARVANPKLQSFNNASYNLFDKTVMPVLDITSAALLGSYKEMNNPIKTPTDVASVPFRPLVGAVKGVTKRLGGDENFYAGRELESSLGKFGVPDSAAFVAGLALETAIPGPGELKYVKRFESAGDIAKALSKGNKVKSVAESVVQAINPKTGEQVFMVVEKSDLPKFKNLIDGQEGIAGHVVNGWNFHLTAKSPKAMENAGFKFSGTADASKVESMVNEFRSVKPLSTATKSHIPDKTKETITQLQTEMPQNPVDKIMAALKQAKPIRGSQEKLYSEARGKRLGQAIQAGQGVGGEQGYFAQLSKLKGELPKVQYESIRDKVTQQDIDSIFDTVRTSNRLTEWEKISAQGGLSKLFGAEGTAVPTESELKLLNEVLGPDFTKTLLDKRGTWEKILNTAGEVLNISRSLMASVDLSAPFRQGIFLIGRPKQWGSAFASMFKQFASEGAYKAAQEQIVSRPNYKLMRQHKLAITDTSPILSQREEQFMSNFAERIPGIGGVVRASGRAYSGFLNKLRADVFDDIVAKGKAIGLENDEQFLQSTADFVNAATGRGKLGALERAAPVLNGLLFSPRLMASRLNLLNPMFYAKLHPTVRKEALKSLFSFAGVGLSILAISKLAGAEVSGDPRSSDFGKIKIGNTRVDPWGGFQQYIRAAAQLLTGQIVSSTTGKITTVGEGYKPLTRFDIAQRFVESKEAPIPSFVLALLKGENNLGQEFNLSDEVANRLIPMYVQDVYDLIKEQGAAGIPLAIPGIFGMGVQTYGTETPQAELNAAGEPVVKMKQSEGLAELVGNLIKGEDKVSMEGATPSGGANAWYRYLKTKSPEEANKIYKTIKEKNPQLASKIKKEAQYAKLNIQPEDIALTNLGVADGKRAEEIYKRANKLDSREEKNAYIKRLKEAGIVTDRVREQLVKLAGMKGKGGQ